MIKVRYTFIIACSLILLLLSVISLVSGLTSSECEKEEKEQFVHQCYSRVATNTNDILLCGRSKEYSGHCFYQIAINLRDPLLCKNADKFQHTCYTELAIKSGDFTVCAQATDPQRCFRDIYEETQDQQICNF